MGQLTSMSRQMMISSLLMLLIVGYTGYCIGNSREHAGASVIVKNKLKVVESYTKSIRDCEKGLEDAMNNYNLESQIDDSLNRLEMFNELYDTAKAAFDECSIDREKIALKRVKNDEYIVSINQIKQDLSDIETVIGEMRDEKETNRTTMKEKITSLRLENQKLRAVINQSSIIQEVEAKKEKVILEFSRQQGPGLGEVGENAKETSGHKDGRDARLRELIAKGTLNQKDGWERDDQEWEIIPEGEEENPSGKPADQPPRKNRRRRKNKK